MSTVFISHAETDRASARKLANSLVKSGYKVSSDDVPITEDWANSIKESIIKSSNVIILFSTNSATSADVMFEFGVAAALAKPIIVFDMSGNAESALADSWVGDVVYIDASKDFESAAAKVASIGKQ